MGVSSQPLHEVVKLRNALGASRLYVSQCFAPERVLTLVFMADRIEVEVFGPRETESDVGSLSYDNAPELGESWNAFRSFCLRVEACRNRVYDGTQYTHMLSDSGGEYAMTWLNPTWPKNPQQMAVVRSYVEIAEAAGLNRLIRMWRGSVHN
jgi:hypothetical protein